MGGKLFNRSTGPYNHHADLANNSHEGALPPLHTPRMSRTTYFSVRAHVVDALAKHYKHVVVPREAPEKTSYGDVDVLVEGRLDGAAAGVRIEELAKSMGATRWVKRSSRTMSFAIPDSVCGGDEGGAEEVYEYRQIDVYVCRAGEMDWTRMIKSDGDTWNIIGTMLRPVGITANDVGLFVRVREIEMDGSSGKDKAMIRLTSDIVETLDFLGLDRAWWEKGFETVAELFDWIAGLRWFVVFEKGGDDEEKEEEDLEEGQKEKKGLNRKERRRLETREMYRRWVEEYLPSCRPNTSVEGNKPADGSGMRERVLQEALDTFNKMEEYQTRLHKWKMAVTARNLWRRVADSLPPEDEKRNLTMRGLKKRINLLPPETRENDTGEADDDDDEGGKNSEVVQREPPKRDSIDMPGLIIPEFRIGEDEVMRDEEGFLNWIKDHWERVYEAERKRVDDQMNTNGNGKGKGKGR